MDDLIADLALDADVVDDEERCSECGCTEEDACPGGCYWIAPGLCSACGDRRS